MQIEKVIGLVMTELARAETLHPVWPEDVVRACLNVSEEAGELAQAVNNYDENPGLSKYQMITEAVHTAAVAIRFLKNINDK